jgi:hypothetical protein
MKNIHKAMVAGIVTAGVSLGSCLLGGIGPCGPTNLAGVACLLLNLPWIELLNIFQLKEPYDWIVLFLVETICWGLVWYFLFSLFSVRHNPSEKRQLGRDFSTQAHNILNEDQTL